jgi:hypothetical protein
MSESSPSNSSTHRPVLKLKIAASSSGRAARASLPSLDTARQTGVAAREPDRDAALSCSAADQPGLLSGRSSHATHPHEISGATPSPSLPRPVANSARPQSKLSEKPGAAWSDDLKRRMQKEMDALMSR